MTLGCRKRSHNAGSLAFPPPAQKKKEDDVIRVLRIRALFVFHVARKPGGIFFDRAISKCQPGTQSSPPLSGRV